MALKPFKRAIAKQVATLLQHSEADLIGHVRLSRQSTGPQFSLPLAKITGSTDTMATVSERLARAYKPDAWIDRVKGRPAQLDFFVHRGPFMEQVLGQVYREQDRYGWADPTTTSTPTVVIDYSSPNIAKPFHAGHLRSTLLGEYIKRIHRAMGYRAIGINYLGDWGKQYGLLAVGFEIYGDPDRLQTDPIHHLYEVYVKIHRDAEQDPTIEKRAQDYFARMEKGDVAALAQWQTFRDMSIASYQKTYRRLGITFDEYTGESATRSTVEGVYQRLQQLDLLQRTHDGAYVVDLTDEGLGHAVVRRADGTSLYLGRDLAELFRRRSTYTFDRAVYVVGTEQATYFAQLFAVARKMGLEPDAELLHCGFGRVQNMSTRKGTSVFLDDILDHAQEKIAAYMRDDEAKAALADSDVTDTLGVSAILAQDMKARRNKNYAFHWDRMTDAKGDTGVFLQYAHCRLCGIERTNDTIPIRPHSVDHTLVEPQALELVQLIAQFPDQVQTSFDALEPCTLVNYLYRLAHASSAASHVLYVRDVDPERAQARLWLFWAARQTLANGLSLLGISPLKYM